MNDPRFVEYMSPSGLRVLEWSCPNGGKMSTPSSDPSLFNSMNDSVSGTKKMM